MSECIVRMEMPKKCVNCLAWCICGTIHKYMLGIDCDSDWTYEDLLVLTDETGFIKPDDCPIICQLPEGHGRLVDMMDIDSMMENASSTSDESGLYSLVYRDDLDFDRLPTIVPAERSET